METVDKNLIESVVDGERLQAEPSRLRSVQSWD